MKIGIIIGSIRDGRFGAGVGEWVAGIAQERPGATYEVLDLKEFDLPMFTSATIPGAANKQYDDPRVTAWSQAVDACDGFVFITPEYNHGVPGAMKNAHDILGLEWYGKPVGFVGYGAAEGVRAVESWRQIIGNFQQYDVRNQVYLSTFTDKDDNGFAPQERRLAELETMLTDLEGIITQLAK
ncbi:NADPH-dependent FMN reductase [Corynebacterium nasicanis]|uniref:NADPH-dependent FMN reductase n=1 Tax=Corynebacterium nasicanis TaxID=1448267 RepID=A0ABW1QBH1_9CORY